MRVWVLHASASCHKSDLQLEGHSASLTSSLRDILHGVHSMRNGKMSRRLLWSHAQLPCPPSWEHQTSTRCARLNSCKRFALNFHNPEKHVLSCFLPVTVTICCCPASCQVSFAEAHCYCLGRLWKSWPQAALLKEDAHMTANSNTFSKDMGDDKQLHDPKIFESDPSGSTLSCAKEQKEPPMYPTLPI